MITSMLLATLIITVEPDQNPYDIAINYCEEKEGLAQYTDTGSQIEFSCGEEPSKTIIINYQGAI